MVRYSFLSFVVYVSSYPYLTNICAVRGSLEYWNLQVLPLVMFDVLERPKEFFFEEIYCFDSFSSLNITDYICAIIFRFP